MKLTKRQRELLDKLVPRRRAFCLEYLANGFNATQAAIAVGYSEDTARQLGSEVLSFPDVKAAIESLQERELNIKLGTLESRRRAYRKIANAEGAHETRDRLKAMELLGKTHGDFVDRKEITGADGAPLQAQIVLTHDEALAAARRGGK